MVFPLLYRDGLRSARKRGSTARCVLDGLTALRGGGTGAQARRASPALGPGGDRPVRPGPRGGATPALEGGAGAQ
ncbi:hypothetical protein D187_003171 [Cystobacter fuscus DSM 2262]|uniref:Uncharacterized protein n=1 Tax=Cystobacter fuscus (strain ATCC 25194 / DSM 2262 / NBRC 100088 / M29) TaxID=1242864 RepID=S9PAH5_CYSF2|nr:hypothetical protein D187_003171 [Cystobacter fuscus DSM 2262]